MLYNISRLLITALTSWMGYRTVALIAVHAAGAESPWLGGLSSIILGAVIGALVGWLTAPFLLRAVKKAIDALVAKLQKIPTLDVVIGAAGLIAGMIVGALATFSWPQRLPVIGAFLPFVITLSTGYVGAVVAIRKREELLALLGRSPRSQSSGESTADVAAPKIVDTSVIIDGRILDIVRTGFIEGVLLVPTFVLEELQHIADSSDPLRRNRGRRGLDVLTEILQMPAVIARIIDDDFDDLAEVDAKLVRLAQNYRAKILTNDYNLNKVAELQGVSVLNINELANALKPIALPGEELVVQVIKDGREQGQGVGYLDDGTMIVIDDGKRFMGQKIAIEVTSTLQTAAGRMIFGKPKKSEQLAGVSP